MALGLIHLQISLPGCSSLKEKRSRLRPLLARLHREFNVSAAELDYQDSWKLSCIGCAALSNDPNHTRRVLQETAHWLEENWPDVQLVEQRIEMVL